MDKTLIHHNHQRFHYITLHAGDHGTNAAHLGNLQGIGPREVPVLFVVGIMLQNCRQTMSVIAQQLILLPRVLNPSFSCQTDYRASCKEYQNCRTTTTCSNHDDCHANECTDLWCREERDGQNRGAGGRREEKSERKTPPHYLPLRLPLSLLSIPSLPLLSSIA